MPAVQPTKAITAAHRMTDDEVIEAAEAEGFELFWRPIGGKVWVGFVRGDDVPRVRCRAPRDQLHGRLAPARTRVRLTAPERAICAPSPLLAGGIEPRDTDARETERGPRAEDVGDSDPRALESEALTQNRGHPMAMGHTIQFSDASIDKYDEVQDALGWHDGTGAPEGLLAHAAGTTENGFCVVEWWKGGDRLGQVLCGAAHAGVREGRRYSSASDNAFRRALDVHRVLTPTLER